MNNWKEIESEKKALEFYHYLREKGYILFESVVGSQAHGTSTPESDTDKAFVYILPKENIYGTEYVEQLRIHKDYTGYEIKRFLELVKSNNPTILELLYTPEDCIITMHPVFEIYVRGIRDQVLTKRCKDSFSGYASQQISKAKGMNKKQNWERDRVTRKDPIDFCYVIDETGYGTMPLKKYLEDNEMEQKFCGIAKIPNAREAFALFYDQRAHSCFSEEYVTERDREEYKKYLKDVGESVGLGYKGIEKTGEGKNVGESNQLRLSSIPKGESVRKVMFYNQDGYTRHCKDYKEYTKWLENRNTQRWVDNKEHGQQYDGKNLMHCKRLLQIAREIAEDGTVNIRRPNREELMDVRKGNIDLSELIEWAENEMKEIKELFKESTLPEEVDSDLINDTLVDIRREFYDGHPQELAVKGGASKFIKRHKDLSEFQTMIRDAVLSKNPEFVNDRGDVIDDYSKDEFGETFRLFDYIDVKNWVKCDGEYLDTENIYIYEVRENSIVVGGGGDWQKGLVFEIVEHAEEFAIINEYTPEDSDWPDDIGETGFLDAIDVEYKIEK